MCHDHFTRHRAWEDGIERESDDEPAASRDTESEPIPPVSADDDPDEDIELLTDGGDG